jgi:hypothetical protein
VATTEAQITAGAAARLTAAGLVVFANRAAPATDAEMPCVLLNATSSTARKLSHGQTGYTETVSLLVSLYGRSDAADGESQAMAAVDALEQTARRALLTAPQTWLPNTDARIPQFRSGLEAPGSKTAYATRVKHLTLDVELSQEYAADAADFPPLDEVQISAWMARLAGEEVPDAADVVATIALQPAPAPEPEPEP